MVRLLRDARAWHSSISTFCSLQNVTSNSWAWVHPCKNTVTICLPNSTHASISTPYWNWYRETVLPLLGQNYFWLTAQEGDVCDITLLTGGNMWRVGSVMSWCMHLNLTATRGSTIQCGTVSGGAILGMALENVRFKDAHDLNLIANIKPSFASYIWMPSMRPLSLEVRPTTVRVINQ